MDDLEKKKLENDEIEQKMEKEKRRNHAAKFNGKICEIL